MWELQFFIDLGLLATIERQQRGRRSGGPLCKWVAATGEHHMVVSPTECLECVRVGSTELSTAMLGSKAAVAAGDDILVVTLLMFAVAALFIFSSWEL